MNVLILSITAGYGHHASAHAISQALEDKGVNVKTVDLFKYLSKPLYSTVDKGYLFSTKYTPKPYGRIYAALEKSHSSRRSALSYVVTELVSKKFFKIFEEFNPDIIVCTHVFCAMILDELKNMGKLNQPVIGVLTDYTIHPFWDDIPNIEHIVIGSPLLSQKAKKRGISLDRLLSFGIPIGNKFSDSKPKHEARKLLGIDPDKFTVLYMSGSMGFGHIITSVRSLDALEEDFQILCVCGKNEKALAKLSKMKIRKPCKVYGFVDNVDLMMDAADCIITKPGGLTTTESMHKNLPMILTDPIPGQEVRNGEFFSNCGAAILCSKYYPVDEAVHLLYHNPYRRAQLTDSLSQLALPNASATLVQFILNYPV